jgi:phenylalanyl-tRNA synthetase beta chain
MQVSWNWLSEMVDLSALGGPARLAELLTRRGLEVEAMERQDQGFEKVVTAQILERKPHPQADRLSLCKVIIAEGGEPLDIVCGAQNMKAGDKVALAQIGAELPNGVKITQGKIRGEISNGMLCSEEELKLKDSSEGIIILPPATPLGRPMAEILGRNDTIFTLKLTANRSDCLSHWGLAREIAAALGQTAKRPSDAPLEFTGSPISIELEAGESGPQFFGCMIEGVRIGPSPHWLVSRLEALGSRSINNVVDATNWVMLELGQPVHAYDADRLDGGRIRIAMAPEGFELPLLDGTSIKLTGSEIVIADGNKPVGLAGVMGGGNSEVQDATTRVYLECAEFNPTLVRRAASRHVKRTEASHRFERGIDPMGLPHAISRLARLVVELAGGRVAGAGKAQAPSRASFQPKQVRVDSDYFEKFLGMSVEPTQAEKILVSLGCQVAQQGKSWTVTVPSWRGDLSLPQDIAEEVARSIGYDAIRETVPSLTSSPKSITEEGSSIAAWALLQKAKDAMAQAGLCESLNFSFTSRAWLEKFGMSSNALVVNPLSDEHEALVPSLLPGLIRNATDNWNHHFGSEPLAIRLFELRPTFQFPGAENGEKIRALSETETGVQERWKLSFAISGPRYASALRNERGETDFFDIKAIVENLLDMLGTKGVRFRPLSSSTHAGAKGPVGSLFHPGQSVEVLTGNEVAGYFGLLHPAMGKDLKARAPLWIGELDWTAIAKLSRPAYEARTFKAWPEFPSIERDFALVVKKDVTAEKITQLAIKAGRPLAKTAKVFDVYQGTQVAEGMTSIAVRVIFYDESRSLQESEAEAASAKIVESFKKELGAELRG